MEMEIFIHFITNIALHVTLLVLFEKKKLGK